MRMMDELKHMFLYSSKKKVYVPIDEMDKRRNSAILLLSPNTESSIQLTKLDYLYNPNLFKSYYIDRNIDLYINSVEPEALNFDEQEEEVLSESLFSNDNIKFKIEDGASYVDRKYIDSVYNKNTVKEYKNLFGYKAGDMEYIYLPFEKDTLRLQEDFGGLPVFKQTMREETPYMMNPNQSVYQTNKIQDMKHIMKESTEEENIFSAKVISSDSMSMADILEADRNTVQKQLIYPIEFF